MSANKPVLKAFNGKLDIVKAAYWDANQVYDWLKRVAEKPEEFGAPERGDALQAKKVYLNGIREQIMKLSIPGRGQWAGAGTEYRDRTLRPDQHIRRRPNTTGAPPPPPFPYPDPPQQPSPYEVKVSKSEVRIGNAPFPSPPFWNSYDLLGLFLSTIGPAPGSANKKQFFFPLTAMYGWWCYAIGPPNLGGRDVVNFPSCFQCTWKEVSLALPVFFLGASFGGFSGRGLRNSFFWRRLVMYERFKLLSIRTPFDESPKRGPVQPKDMPGTRYGNCAETYPFVSLMMRGQNENTWGIAIGDRFLYDEDLSKIDKHFMDPCDNCISLINDFKGSVINFMGAGQVRHLWRP